MFLIVYYLIVSALAAACKTDGDHAATCASGKCEVVGSTEVCTQCKAGGVPVDGLCRPASSPQATAAGCTGDASAGVCEACSGGFFLFRGGCYSIRAAPGSGVCREARDGACVGHAEENSVDGGRHGAQGSSAQGSTEGVERVRDPQCADTTDHCAASACNVQIGDSLYCSQCKANYVPIDGTCTQVGDDIKTKCKKADGSALENTDTQCGQCGAGYFLHKGGCYQFGGAVGKLICTDPSTPDSSLTAGKCATCATGYFKNPATVAADKPPCIACNDTTGNSGNKGIDKCSTCTIETSPTSDQTAKCTKCETGKYLKSDGTCADRCAPNTEFVKNDPTNGNKCVSCGTVADGGIANCAECSLLPSASGSSTALIKCTKCGNSKYLKDGTCVDKTDCTGTTFPKEDNPKGNKCVPCNDSTNGGIENCGECSLLPSTSRSSTPLVTCSACSTNNLSPLKNECMQNCPAGTYADSNRVCLACHTSCASCKDNNAESSCTACYPGSVLNHGSTPGKGTCIPECTGRYAENCEANQCTAVLGGSKYCSRCKGGFVPVDGLCVSATARAPAGCTPSTTTAGTCESCKNAYFLQSGGCYQAAVYPGNTLCTTTDNNGKCQTCANGQTANSGTGSCPACHPTCKTCTATNDPTKCSACFSGYYLDASKACKKCSETSGNIQGVENCISCEKPSNDSGTVTCYVKTSGGGSGDNSTGSDPKLSSGAIAGISVAVIVVVGGLVGFLCWWFICRGKA